MLQVCLDVALGNVCSDAAITNPFDQGDLYRFVGGGDEVTTTTQAPSDSKMSILRLLLAVAAVYHPLFRRYRPCPLLRWAHLFTH